MESLTIIILFVSFTCVLATEKGHSESTLNPQNMTDDKEFRAAQFKKHIVDCTEETKVDPKFILSIRSGKWRQALRKQPWTLKKWMLCLLVKSDMMSQDGVLRQNVVLANVPQKDRAKVENVIDKCLYSQRREPTDIAWHFVTCFRSLLSKYSIL